MQMTSYSTSLQTSDRDKLTAFDNILLQKQAVIFKNSFLNLKIKNYFEK